jgi:hypothetical protein
LDLRPPPIRTGARPLLVGLPKSPWKGGAMSKGTAVLGRVAAAVEEAILEHELSERELERLSGVSRWWIHRLLRGEEVRPDLLMRLAGVILVLDVVAPIAPVPPAPEVSVVDDLAVRLAEVAA